MSKYIIFLNSFLIMLGLTMSSQYNCYAKDTEKFVVVLDPGHGGKDIGTPHRLYKKDEKTIALDV
ncbi:MAG: N-acetylmuramoyl-L-alanine amidase, partial [Bacteroidales bacterium]|nr:N-acetylmuramoyl-L-alanine amidase [Bacteroidales bacterium]